MSTPTAWALTGFMAWALALLVLMEAIRSWLVLTKTVPANGFNPDNSNLSPFMQRLARAHANCIEGLPLFGGLMLVALVTGRSAVTDPLAMVLLGRAHRAVLHPPGFAQPHGRDPAFQRLRGADGHRRLVGLAPAHGLNASVQPARARAGRAYGPAAVARLPHSPHVPVHARPGRPAGL